MPRAIPGYGYGADGDSAGVWGDERQGRGAYAQAPWWRDDPRHAAAAAGLAPARRTPPWWEDEDPRQRRSRRVDPDYPWRNQIY